MRRRPLATAALAVVLLGGLAACGDDDQAKADTAPAGTVTIGAQAGGIAKPTELKVDKQQAIADLVPEAIKSDGKLTIGLGALPTGFPPLAFVGDDDKTFTGAEPDLGRLVAAVLGLKPEFNNDTWDNLFVGLDSGKNEVGFSNITDTEQRKEKYDFASYRQDNLGFAVKAGNSWNFDKNYQNLAGLKVAVGAGTNQEKILVAWQEKLKAEGKTLDIKYFADTPSTFKAIVSGQIDGYFGPNPGIAYQISKTKGTADEVRNAGVYSGAGASMQGLIAATTKKDNGLVKALAAAINYLIQTGQYKQWLAAYNLDTEAVDSSAVNPPGLPKSNA
ncbi:transporter substrate-binding domain-containing protein [Dactylosporangium matsuzakiense]|uniref:Amino acid ABC transporter, substrate-binding protein n=1 Tax=Dactylosporangium matsuzakiense TaxID=53360 RepID=A0A9W6KFX6_9ACTN|nr:transporter substrate-binding domain-containing protein [Dactylosporangium matsuzakiense]GLK99314.1 putative amino acid ABC transporter, substrate-binding protein [Dactylosporangium matsuzakiense]